MAQKKKSTEKIEPLLKSEILMKKTVSEILKGVITHDREELRPEIVKEMLRDVDIAYNSEKLKRAVCSKEWEISSLIQEDSNLAKELEMKFSNIDIHNLLHDIDMVRYYGFGAFEIIWDRDFRIEKLVSIPQKFISWDKEKGWYIDKGSEEILLNDPYKYQVLTYNSSLDRIKGGSILTPLYSTYMAKREIEKKMREIAENYGEVITVFAYNEHEDLEKVKERGNNFKNLQGKNAIAVPVSGEKGIKDSMHFITLSDLKIEIHLELEDRWSGKIAKHISGADYSKSTSSVGSLARDGVQQGEQKKHENEVLKFARDFFQKILEIDGNLHGYDSKGFFIKFLEEVDREKEYKIDLIKKQGDKLTFEIANSLGFEVKKEYVAERLGIPLESLTNKDTEFARGRTEFQD